MKYKCPLCYEEHATKSQRTMNVTVKGIEIEYINQYLYCPVEDEFLQDGDMLNANLQRARESFEEKTGMKFSEYKQ